MIVAVLAMHRRSWSVAAQTLLALMMRDFVIADECGADIFTIAFASIPKFRRLWVQG